MSEYTNISLFGDLLQQLTLILDQARKVPFTDNVIINKEAFSELIMKIRANERAALFEAQKIVSEENNILSKAQQDANAIIQNANLGAKQKLSESENFYNTKIKEANEYYSAKKNEADGILTQVKADVERAINEANLHAQNIINQGKMMHDSLVGEQQVVADANAEAERIKQRAIELAQLRKSEIYGHIISLIGDLETSFSEYSAKIIRFKNGLNSELKQENLQSE